MGKIKIAAYLVLFLLSWSSVAQVNRYMVFFNDKNGTPHSVSSPLTFLSQRAIDRRAAQNISIIEEDLPVTPLYVQSIRDAGVTVLYKTKWMNGVLVECTSSDATSIAGLAFVKSVEQVAPGGRPPTNGRKRSSRKFNDASASVQVTDMQISMLGMEEMHASGYRGEGMLMAIIDAGFPGADTISFFRHVFDDGRFHAEGSYDFVFGLSNVFDHYSEPDQRHGTWVWSTIAAFKKDVFTGGAYKADFVLFVTEDTPTEYRIEEYNWLFAAERADSLGVDIISTSLGYNTFDDSNMNYSKPQMDGETAVITRASAMAANKGMAVVVSAGNEGNNSWGIITAPADGKNILAVGSVSASGVRSSTSSKGPSADGRFKPDVAAMGSSVSVVLANGTLGTQSGTSFAAPLMASLVAGYWQKLPDLTAQQLLDTIRRRGNQFDNPDNFLGFGIPSFYSSVTTAVNKPIENFVNIYPNPVSSEVWLEFLDGKDLNFKTLLVDARGAVQTLHPNQLEKQKFQIDLSNQPAGIYLLKLSRGSTIFTHKIFKVD